MNNKLKLLLLIIVIFFASILRLWSLGAVPISPNWDEVALAYDAHSLFLTGRDEYGEFLPIVLRSFDDYKPAIYAYLAIIPVELFGMNAFAVRLPSAVFGIIAVIATYFFVKELFNFNHAKQNNNKKNIELLAIISAFFLAISPWHIQFSRIAFESNVGLTFNILTALFFIKGLKNNYYLILSALFAGLNLSVYQSERVFTPIFVLALIIIFRKEIFSISKKTIVLSLIIGLLSIAPLALYITNHQEALVRVKATSIFTNKTQLLERNIGRLESDKKRNDPIGLILDNRRITYVKTVASSYLAHFDLNWLFVKGDINRHHAPRMGLLYLITLPLLLVGIYKLTFDDYGKKAKQVVFAWLLIAPIPASVTFEVPHAVRDLNVLPALQILIAIGLISSFEIIPKQKIIKNALAGVFVILALFNFVYFINQYFVQQNYFHAYDWLYGYDEAIKEVQLVKDQYKKVVVSDKVPMDKSYMFFLYYLNYPPSEYQKIGSESSGKFDSTHHFDKYEFRKIDWDNDQRVANTLYVGTPADFSKDIKTTRFFKVIKVINYPNGDPAIKIVGT